MRRQAMFATTGVVLVLALGGCGDSAPPAESTAPAEPAATAPAEPAATEPAASDGNCTTAEVDGTTTNAEMLALATEVYNSLECGTQESLPDQLKARGQDPDVQAQAQDAGLTISVDSAAGGTVMAITEGTSGCNVTVLDSFDAKTLTCLDV
jgi:hypothetical protein